MTAVVFTRAGNGPSTHAIVIGVGHYPHLPGGSAKKKYPDDEGMTQLSSPPASAREFAKWLIENYECPAAPLRSLSLLVSEKKPAPFTYTLNEEVRSFAVKSAAMGEVTEALKAWRAKGDKRPDNKLLFYFCGHGISAGTELSLLAEDFGADSTAPLKGALDFRKFRGAMEECDARHQVYFVDACRVGSELLKNNGGYAGEPVFNWTGKASPNGDPRLGPVFYSTLAGAPAYAKLNEPTLFTTALIDSLRGAAAVDNEHGHWEVRTSRILETLEHFMTVGSARLKLPRKQIAPADDVVQFGLNMLAAPYVPVVVEVTPEQAHLSASLRCENGEHKHARDKPHKDPWRFMTPQGKYDFHFEFKKGGFAIQPLVGEPVRPPLWRRLLKA